MKANMESRVSSFMTELEKFAARWHQLKPSQVDLDAQQDVCLQALAGLKERRAEFDALLKTAEELR